MTPNISRKQSAKARPGQRVQSTIIMVNLSGHNKILTTVIINNLHYKQAFQEAND